MAESSSPVSTAPGDLEFVRCFVNTLDVEQQTDQLGTPSSATAWATARGVGAVDQEQLHGVVQLREALRDALEANHDRAGLPEHTAAALTSAAHAASIEVAFTADGVVFRAPAGATETVGGRVARYVAAALEDGSWERLKVCRDDACRWAFYDTSRSRTGKWCSMGICGNRNKQARWRASAQQSATQSDRA